MKKYKCWDEDNNRWIYDDGGDQNFFKYEKGQWSVKYILEINIPGYEGTPEKDVPVIREVENPVVCEVQEPWYEVLAYHSAADLNNSKYEFIRDAFTDVKELAIEYAQEILSKYYAVTVRATDKSFAAMFSTNQILYHLNAVIY